MYTLESSGSGVGRSNNRSSSLSFHGASQLLSDEIYSSAGHVTMNSVEVTLPLNLRHLFQLNLVFFLRYID